MATVSGGIVTVRVLLPLPLFVGEATIKTHVSNVLTKLGLRDRVQAVVFAHENGVVTAGE
jgi:hypothetical protein